MVTVERQSAKVAGGKLLRARRPLVAVATDLLRPLQSARCTGIHQESQPPGLQGLVMAAGQRNKMLNLLPSSDDLFGAEQSSCSAKKRKAAHVAEEPEHVDVPLPDGRSIRVRACTKKSEDILELVFSYLTSEPFEFQAATRTYVRSGKFCRKKKRGDPNDGPDSEQDED